MPVRSTTIAAGALAANTPSLVLRVPAGYTALIKSILGHNFLTAQSSLDINLRFPPAAGLLAAHIVIAASTSYVYDCWLALDPGWEVTLNSTQGGPVHFIMSGALLPGVSPTFGVVKPAELVADE